MNLHVIKYILPSLIILVLASCGSLIHHNNHQLDAKKAFANNDEEKSSDSDVKSSQNTGNLIRILEQNLSYQLNNRLHRDTAFLKYNDNQNYSIYILPEYELKENNSSKDTLYLTKNKEIFMQIELLSDYIDWNSQEAKARQELAEFSKEVTLKTLLGRDNIGETTILEVKEDHKIITTYLINNQDIKVKLMMYTQTNEDHRDVFFQMAKTIMKEIPRS